jgi:hypothetical protein
MTTDEAGLWVEDRGDDGDDPGMLMFVEKWRWGVSMGVEVAYESV